VGVRGYLPEASLGFDPMVRVWGPLVSQVGVVKAAPKLV
jgi:hypothetical protein